MKDYLYGLKPFYVVTDNNPLTHVLATAQLDATGHTCRWFSALSAFNFPIHQRSRKKNADADTLSRSQKQILQDCREINLDSVGTTCICQNIQQTFVETICSSAAPVYIPDELDIEGMTNRDWVQQQLRDPEISIIYKYVRDGYKPHKKDRSTSIEGLNYLKNFFSTTK